MITMPRLRVSVLSTRNRMVPRDVARKLTQKIDVGDWWLIYMIGQNLDPIVYRDVLAQLLNRLEMRNNHQIDDKL